ncbi:MAG TPA: hypothetical protein VFQ35_00155 [Polyangiaceae bacterium]|nr:hypothetical protein [Polyangiaceae bacterium]
MALIGGTAHAREASPHASRSSEVRRATPPAKSSDKARRSSKAQPRPKPTPPKPSSEATFVTEGWAIERRFDADLDGDGARDRVLVVLQHDADKTEFRRRALVILLRREGGYILGGQNDKLINCLDCGGVRGGDGSPQLEIQRGSLVVTQYIGSREYSSVTSRFRWSAERRRFELIGEDKTQGDALTGESLTTSCNLLTFACIETKTPPQVDDQGNDRRAASKRRSHPLPRKPPTPLEEVTAPDW